MPYSKKELKQLIKRTKKIIKFLKKARKECWGFCTFSVKKELYRQIGLLNHYEKMLKEVSK